MILESMSRLLRCCLLIVCRSRMYRDRTKLSTTSPRFLAQGASKANKQQPLATQAMPAIRLSDSSGMKSEIDQFPMFLYPMLLTAQALQMEPIQRSILLHENNESSCSFGVR